MLGKNRLPGASDSAEKKLCAEEIGGTGPLIEKKQMLRNGLITCRQAAG